MENMLKLIEMELCEKKGIPVLRVVTVGPDKKKLYKG